MSRVVDGDTIEISPAVDGNDEVRLIGVDTPETKDPEEGVEPYGPEASAFATDELSGHSVELELDVEREDQYDRLLAYVYVSGQMFNEDLLEEGYACAYPYPPNSKYESRLAEAQEEARAGGLGIWGLSLDQQCQLADGGKGIGEGSIGCDIIAEKMASATATATATAGGAAGGAVPPISEEHCPPNAPSKATNRPASTTCPTTPTTILRTPKSVSLRPRPPRPPVIGRRRCDSKEVLRLSRRHATTSGASRRGTEEVGAGEEAGGVLRGPGFFRGLFTNVGVKVFSEVRLLGGGSKPRSYPPSRPLPPTG